MRPGAAVRNSSPEIRGIQFVGGDGRPGNTLGVEAEGYDADGDPVQFEIVWQKNGQPAGTGNRLTAPVKRGDKVTVTVTPFDGKERGKSATLSREILNTPPAIEGQEQFQVSDNAVTFHVRASDADGDPLTFSIKDAPAGMSIDRKTGLVRWVTSPGTTGKVPFTVIVSDGSGGESTARFYGNDFGATLSALAHADVGRNPGPVDWKEHEREGREGSPSWRSSSPS